MRTELYDTKIQSFSEGFSNDPIDRIQLLEGQLDQDHEPPEVTTRNQLQQVQPLNIHDINNRNVLEGLHKLGALGSLHNQWTLPIDVAAVTHLTLTGKDCVPTLGLSMSG